jgi:hypothetical protein
MNSKRWCGAVVGVLVTLAGSVALAADPSVSVGASENVGLDDGEHYGFYPAVMGALAFEAGPVVLVPAVGVEGCAELGAWGFIGSFAVDVPVHDHVGIDVAAMVVHDQEGDAWDEATVSIGGGLGASVFLDQWSISPMVAVFGVPGEPGLILSPSLTVSYTFDLSSDPVAPPVGPAIGSVK